ncbi:uncharacterized protein LOC144164716 [Haemaphysalis longicornis]
MKRRAVDAPGDARWTRGARGRTLAFRWSQPRPSTSPASASSRPNQGCGAAPAEALWDHVTLDSEELAHQAWGVTEICDEEGTGASVEQRPISRAQAAVVRYRQSPPVDHSSNSIAGRPGQRFGIMTN